MDKLQLKVQKKEIDSRTNLSVNIFINNRNLIDLLREYEMPFAIKEGHPEIAGGYVGMTPKDFLYWLTEASWPGGNKHAIFECAGCGEIGCWPIIISVSKKNDVVRWFDFNQPHRGNASESSFWDFSKFPTFKFSIKNYNTEIYKLTKLIS